MRRSACFAVLLGLVMLGCTRVTPPAKKPKTFTPSSVLKDDVATHEFFRDVTFTEFSPSLPEGSIDMLEFDAPEGERYVIVRVTAERTPEKLAAFTTTFTMEDGSTIVRKWQTASGNTRTQAQAVFMMPTTVTAASTTSEESDQAAGN